MTLPAFEAPVAATPAQANPFAQPVATTAVQASPAVEPVAATPAQANPFTQPAQANPFTQSVQANPFTQPAQANPFAQPAQANPFTQPVVLASPNAPPVQATATPSAPPVYQTPSAPPVYPTFGAQSDDVNPIVRPAYASVRPAYASPSARPVVEQPVHASPNAPPVVEAAVASVSEPPWVAPAIVEPTRAAPVVVEPALVAPAIVEPALVAPAIVEPALVEPALVAPAIVEPALVAPAQASVPEVEVPVVEAPVAKPHAPANAFETAQTEFAGSETPIARADAEATVAPAHSVEAASAEAPISTEAPVAAMTAAGVGWIETPALPTAESVVAEAEIQEQASAPKPFPAARSFTSSGSEMPVVITTPAPYQRDSSGPTSNLFGLGRELLPRAQAWSRKTLRANPRALVIAAPLVALFGIWAIRSLVSHPKHTAVAEANTDAVAQLAAATPSPQVTTAASAAAPAAILATTGAAPSAPAPGADPAELASAVTHGLPALEALAQKFPNDPQVGIALASQQAQAQRFEAAVESVERVISLDSKSAQNGKVMGILWRAAQSSASEPSFTALRKLGGRGSDIAFDLATTAGVRDAVRERAKTELAKSLSADASADTRVASALLLAPDCGSRKSLLERAEREGGKRTQAMLEGFSRGSVCASKADKACNSCLTGSPALTHALATLSAGGGK